MKNFVKFLTAALFLISIALIGCKKNTDDNPGGSNITVNRNPLCFTAEEAGATIEMTGGDPSIRFEYSYDGNNWNTFTPDATLITLNNVGDVVYFRGNNPDGLTPKWEYHPPIPGLSGGYYPLYIKFVTNDKKISASGNIMSLIDKTCSTLTIPNNQCFRTLFINTSITTAPELPATTLKDSCYYRMFEECDHLINPPQLPATNMTTACYSGMFAGCGSLKRAPELPSKNLAPFCYAGMFAGVATYDMGGCYSLIIAPELPATTLSEGCYYGMFGGCRQLNNAPELPATNLAKYCYLRMFYRCESLAVAPELPATTLAEGCYSGMFEDCYSLYHAPELPATTLADGCYSYMFACDDYSSSMGGGQLEPILSTGPNLPATSLAPECYSYMFWGSTNLRNSPELPATELVTDCYKGMFNGCRNLNNICIHFEQWSQNTEEWVGEPSYTYFSPQGIFRCPSSLPQEFGPDRIPEGWTVETF